MLDELSKNDLTLAEYTGKVVLLYRTLRGIKQGELAKQLDVCRRAVSNWERGLLTPNVENLMALSKLFDVPVSVFFPKVIEGTGMSGAVSKPLKDDLTLREYIGEVVRMHRVLHDITQLELGNEVGVSFSNVSYWESGTRAPNANNLFKLAQYFNVPVGDFFPPVADKE